MPQWPNIDLGSSPPLPFLFFLIKLNPLLTLNQIQNVLQMFVTCEIKPPAHAVEVPTKG